MKSKKYLLTFGLVFASIVSTYFVIVSSFSRTRCMANEKARSNRGDKTNATPAEKRANALELP